MIYFLNYFDHLMGILRYQCNYRKNSDTLKLRDLNIVKNFPFIFVFPYFTFISRFHNIILRNKKLMKRKSQRTPNKPHVSA